MPIKESVVWLVTKHSVVVILSWLLLAGIGFLSVPQLEHVVEANSRAYLPTDATSNLAVARMGEAFRESQNSNLNSLILERQTPLTPQDLDFYVKLVNQLRGDRQYVHSVLDAWSDPATAAAGRSEDGKSAYAMVSIAGDVGTTTSNQALEHVRRVVSQAVPPAGLAVYFAGPGSAVADEIAVVDSNILRITMVTVVLIAVLLLIVYRSAITAAIPMLSVAVTLGVARSAVALLGEHQVIEVSVFSTALMTAMILGAGTDYSIFLLGRYHEERRAGVDPAAALRTAWFGVAPVIVASTMTVALACACLTFARVGVLRSAGLPCAIGVVVAMIGAVTLVPALIRMASKFGFAEPKSSVTRYGWRRLAVVIVRWPAPVLTGTLLVLIVCALPLAVLKLSFNELKGQPADTPSNLAFAAADRHFGQNRLMPDLVLIQADHDLRNAADLIELDRVSAGIFGVDGVNLVQSVTRPFGTPLREAALTNQAGVAGEQLLGKAAELDSKLAELNSLPVLTQDLEDAIGRIDSAIRSGGRVVADNNQAIAALDARINEVSQTVGNLNQYLGPVRDYRNSVPNCPDDFLCSRVDSALSAFDVALGSVDVLTAELDRVSRSLQTVDSALNTSESAVGSITEVVDQAERISSSVSQTFDGLTPMLQQTGDYLRGIGTAFDGSQSGGFYLPESALADPRVQKSFAWFIAPDGHAARFLVFGDGETFGDDGIHRTEAIAYAVQKALKGGRLQGSTVSLTGAGASVKDLESLVAVDFRQMAIITLSLVYLILLVMLRSPVAAAAVLGTVCLSYCAALGVAVFVWQVVLDTPIHWVVISISFLSLVAVGADYNLLLAARIREEIARARLRTGIIRALAGTGGVVTTAGIVFGITMFAMLAGDAASIAQVGFTIGVGLLLDTLLVRAFLIPSIAALLGRWFWWPMNYGRGFTYDPRRVVHLFQVSGRR